MSAYLIIKAIASRLLEFDLNVWIILMRVA